MSPSRADTIVAVATARGPAARGVVRLAGPDATAVVAARFDRPLEGRVVEGSFDVAEPRGSDAFARAPAALWIFRAPKSYTGDDVVELHLPGAPHLLDLVVRLLVQDGARIADPGEFTRRAAEAGKLDLTRAEAVLATIRARDDAEHRRARALLDGGLAREVAALAESVVLLLVPLELSLDFSDQDVEIVAPKDHALRIAALASEVRRRATPASGLARRSLHRVVLRGPANAGKSSLFNGLLGRDAALASPIRGTTRDVLTGLWEKGGVRAMLVDTAGDDVHGSALDALAHDARERALLEADLALDVFDARAPVASSRPAGAVASLQVATFADRLPADAAAAVRARGVRLVSNATGEGLSELEEDLVEALNGAGGASEPILVPQRAAALLSTAADLLDAAAVALPLHPPEFAASDLRAALRALRSVLFADAGDPVLDRIFRDFCIGK